MKDKIKIEFNDNERSLILESLNNMRNQLTLEQRTTEPIDDILLKFNNETKIEFEKNECLIVINSLNNFRNKLKNENKSPSDVNDIILRIISETDKKRFFKEDNER